MTNNIRIRSFQFTLKENRRSIRNLKKIIQGVVVLLSLISVFFYYQSLWGALFVLDVLVLLYLAYLFYSLYRYRKINKQIIKKIRSLTNLSNREKVN